MNQIKPEKTSSFLNQKLFEMKLKNPGSQIGSLHYNPNLSHYILGKREKSYIFDFDYTLICIERSLRLISKILKLNGKILLVSTDFSSSLIVKKAGQLSSQPFIHFKWINGLLTNWKQIIPHKQNNIFKSTQKEKGILNLKKLPDLLIVVNPSENGDAIREARKLNIPVISFLNIKKISNLKTEMKISQIDYPIPASGNSIQLIYLFFDLFIRISKKCSASTTLKQNVYQYSYASSRKVNYLYTY